YQQWVPGIKRILGWLPRKQGSMRIGETTYKPTSKSSRILTSSRKAFVHGESLDLIRTTQAPLSAGSGLSNGVPNVPAMKTVNWCSVMLLIPPRCFRIVIQVATGVSSLTRSEEQ